MTSENSPSLSKTTKDILSRHGIKLNKNLGQNYLIDKNKRDQIINFGDISKEDVILEIGTGIGTLTIELAKRAKKVIAIEQDKKIFEILAQRLEDEKIDNVELINDDALKVDFPPFNKIISKSSQTFLTKSHHRLLLNSLTMILTLRFLCIKRNSPAG